MKREAYAAARIVSPTVHAYFARRMAQYRNEGPGCPAPVPEAEAIEAMIDAAFWASLRREEGYLPRISLAFLSPDQAAHPLVFERALPLAPAALTRIAPAVERHGIHLGVWHSGEDLYVWGTTRTIPGYCFVLEVAAPGLLVVKHHSGDEAGKFVNVVLLEGDLIKLVDEHASETPECPELLTSLLGFAPSASWAHSVNVLVQLALSMREHGRGRGSAGGARGQRGVAGIDCGDGVPGVAAVCETGGVEPAGRGARRTGADRRMGGGTNGGGWRGSDERPV